MTSASPERRPGVKLAGISWDHVRGMGGVRAAAGAFAAQHPDVDVRWAARSLQAFAGQPIEELARRYDLIVLDHPSIGHAVARGALLPLDEFLGAEFLADQAANSVGRSHESYTWQGHQWALAVDAAAQVAAYRPDLLARRGAEVPRTWEQVFALAERAPHAVAMPLIGVDAVCAFIALCEGSGAAHWPPHRAAADAALATLERLATAAHPRSLTWNPPGLLDHMTAADEVAYCPLVFGYAAYAQKPSRRLRFAPAPRTPDGLPRGTLGGAGLAVSAWTAQRETACALAAFTASAATQCGVYFDGGGQPGHRSAWKDPRINGAAPGFFAETLPSLDRATLRPRHDGFLAWQDRAGAAIHAYLERSGSREALLDGLAPVSGEI
jgi:multiple sugar transport system substrate-binding protein